MGFINILCIKIKIKFFFYKYVSDFKNKLLLIVNGFLFFIVKIVIIFVDNIYIVLLWIFVMIFR